MSGVKVVGLLLPTTEFSSSRIGFVFFIMFGGMFGRAWSKCLQGHLGCLAGICGFKGLKELALLLDLFLSNNCSCNLAISTACARETCFIINLISSLSPPIKPEGKYDSPNSALSSPFLFSYPQTHHNILPQYSLVSTL